jgi:hypothetical protein
VRALGILLLALGATAAWAGDPPAAPGDPIAAARRDFASIKSLATPAEPGAGLAGATVKADGAGEDAAPSAPPSVGGPPGRKEGTGNWLVDAMEQRPDQPRAPGGMDALIRADLDLLKAAGRPDEAKHPQAGERSAPGALAGPVYNPLDAFMSGWVSPQDRELLLQGRGENPLGAAQGATRAQPLPGLDLGRTDAPAGGVPGPRDASPFDPRPSANPYVADLSPEPVAPARTLSSPDMPGFAPLELPDLSHGMSATGLGAKPADTARPLAPNFAQPADDDKFFKQMKRF